MKNRERGFTLIELLVVIAIIGVLSSVVLSSLNSARGKGNDAKVKAQLSSARGSAEIFYSNQTPAPSYTGLCTVTSADTSGMYQYLLASNYPDNVAPSCGTSATAYAVWHALPFVGGYWCVDSVGASKAEASAPAAGATVCP